MPGPLDGVRVVEAATHVFVPMAGALLAEWGAQVVKVEHPVTGDPYRGLVTAGLHTLHDGVDPFFQAANRSKRSVGIDLATDGGRRLLGRLVAVADVFTTNLRPGARRRLRIDVDDVRADNPSIVYARGTAFGSDGPDAERGGYDAGAYWARSGMQALFTDPDAPWPTPTRPAFGDVAAAMGLAAGIASGAVPPHGHRRARGRRLVAARRRHVAGAERPRERPARRRHPRPPTRPVRDVEPAPCSPTAPPTAASSP